MTRDLLNEITQQSTRIKCIQQDKELGTKFVMKAYEKYRESRLQELSVYAMGYLQKLNQILYEWNHKLTIHDKLKYLQ